MLRTLCRSGHTFKYNPSSLAQRRLAHNPADDPLFKSVVDDPPNLVRAGRRHGAGLIILGTPKKQRILAIS